MRYANRPVISSLLLFALYGVITPSHAQGVSCSAVEGSGWAPQTGHTEITADRYSRYVYAYFGWFYAQNMEWWKRPYAPGANSQPALMSIRQFFICTSYDGRAYGNAPSGYWNATFPSPYVDTQAFDSSNEKTSPSDQLMLITSTPTLTIITSPDFRTVEGQVAS